VRASGSASGSARLPLRKITPVQPSPYEEPKVTRQISLAARLQDSFLAQRPNVRRLVDFVVDTTVKNACTSAVHRCAIPAVQEAFEWLLSTRPVSASGAAEMEWVEGAAEQAMKRAEQEAVTTAVHYARTYISSKVPDALLLLAPPDERRESVEMCVALAKEHALEVVAVAVGPHARTEVRLHMQERISKLKRSMKAAQHLPVGRLVDFLQRDDDAAVAAAAEDSAQPPSLPSLLCLPLPLDLRPGRQHRLRLGDTLLLLRLRVLPSLS